MKVGNIFGFLCGILSGMVGSYGFILGLNFWGVWLFVSFILIVGSLIAENN